MISTAGSDFDTLLAVYPATNSVVIAANDDDVVANTNTSRIYFNATNGATYHIAVDGKNGASGHIVLNLTQGPAPNDDFAYRLPITNFPVVITGTTFEATLEPDEPNAAYANLLAGNTLWWSWKAAVTQKVHLDTTGSSFRLPK